MIDGKDLFPDKEAVIGHIETNSGGILLTDGGWEDDLPLTTQESLALDLNIESSAKIPVFAFRKNNKRFLVLAIDDAVEASFVGVAVEVTDKVEEPKEDELESESQEKTK